MAEVQLPYSVDRFNAVPDLADARDAFAAKDGPVFFDNVFVPLIQKHGVDDKIGLCLLHRHFGLDGTEKLVEFNNVSLPWQDNGSETPMTVGGHILPSSWLIQDDKVMPYEFFFSAPGKEKTSLDLAIPENRAFVNEFVQAVKDADLAGCVGLRVCPEGDFDDTLEIQQGRANVNFSKGQYDVKDLDHATTAMWFLKPNSLPKSVPQKTKCYCTKWVKQEHLHVEAPSDQSSR